MLPIRRVKPPTLMWLPRLLFDAVLIVSAAISVRKENGNESPLSFSCGVRLAHPTQ